MRSNREMRARRLNDMALHMVIGGGLVALAFLPGTIEDDRSQEEIHSLQQELFDVRTELSEAKHKGNILAGHKEQLEWRIAELEDELNGKEE